MAIRPALQHAGMRANNLALVMGEVADSGSTTRAALATATGLTKSSVSALVADLLAAGLVAETSARTGERGRPGTRIALSAQGTAGLGLEINVDYVAAVVADLTGAARYRHVLSCDNRGRSPADVLADAAGLAEAAEAAAAEQGLRLAGTCLAVPGTIDQDSHRVLRAPNLGWEMVAVDTVSAGLPLGAAVENEADLAALGELWFGAPDLGDFVHVSGEIGIGGGIVTGGRLFRGAHARAGELGHIVVDPGGPVCSCGGRGCLERMAGLGAMLERAGASDAHDLRARLTDGESRAAEAVSLAGGHLGVGLATVTRLLDPASIVLGGVFSSLAPWLLPSVEDGLGRHVAGRRERPRLVVSVLGSDAAVRGAAGSVVRRVIADPAAFLAQQEEGSLTPR